MHASLIFNGHPCRTIQQSAFLCHFVIVNRFNYFIGIYVNYLELNNLIVLPVFGREEDKQALEIIQKAFPDKIVETINYDKVAQEGGLLNCTTWVSVKYK